MLLGGGACFGYIFGRFWGMCWGHVWEVLGGFCQFSDSFREGLYRLKTYKKPIKNIYIYINLLNLQQTKFLEGL